MTDPWLLVANRQFQDLRGEVDRERLLRSGELAPRGRGVPRLRAAVASALSALRPIRSDDMGPAIVPTDYEHPLLDADGGVCVVEAADREGARDIHRDAHRLVRVSPVRGGSHLAAFTARR